MFQKKSAYPLPPYHSAIETGSPMAGISRIAIVYRGGCRRIDFGHWNEFSNNNYFSPYLLLSSYYL